MDDGVSGATRSHRFGSGIGGDLSRRNVACPLIFGVSERRARVASDVM